MKDEQKVGFDPFSFHATQFHLFHIIMIVDLIVDLNSHAVHKQVSSMFQPVYRYWVESDYQNATELMG